MTRGDSKTGVRVTRRKVLEGTAALPAILSLNACGERARPEAAAQEPPSDVAAFLEQWADRALDLASSPQPNEDAFLHELCAGLARREPSAMPGRLRTSFDEMGMKIGPVAGNNTFQVLEIEVAPHAVIPAHNHVGYCFVSMAVRGSALAQHFEIDGTAPEPGSDLETRFRVREVSSVHLTSGRVTTLTRARGNIHGFRAGPDGVTLIDFGVHFGDPGPGPRSFSVIEVDERLANPDNPKPGKERSDRIYPARWLGNIYAKSS